MQNRIKSARKVLGLTQTEFGSRIGVSGASISKLESGDNKPSDRTLMLMSAVYKISLEWLRTGKGQMFSGRQSLIDELMQNINDRVKLLRKKLGLTQIEFGKKILMSQGQLTSVEHGKRNVTDRTVKLICSEFRVSEKWLRTGEGQMFSGRQSLIDELTAKYKFEDYVRKMLEEYIRLDPTGQAVVLDYAHRLVAGILAEVEPEDPSLPY